MKYCWWNEKIILIHRQREFMIDYMSHGRRPWHQSITRKDTYFPDLKNYSHGIQKQKLESNPNRHLFKIAIYKSSTVIHETNYNHNTTSIFILNYISLYPLTFMLKFADVKTLNVWRRFILIKNRFNKILVPTICCNIKSK